LDVCNIDHNLIHLASTILSLQLKTGHHNHHQGDAWNLKNLHENHLGIEGNGNAVFNVVFSEKL
jgi:hypothetical protein